MIEIEVRTVPRREPDRRVVDDCRSPVQQLTQLPELLALLGAGTFVAGLIEVMRGWQYLF